MWGEIAIEATRVAGEGWRRRGERAFTVRSLSRDCRRMCVSGAWTGEAQSSRCAEAASAATALGRGRVWVGDRRDATMLCVQQWPKVKLSVFREDTCTSFQRRVLLLVKPPQGLAKPSPSAGHVIIVRAPLSSHAHAPAVQ
jgi:hypothetical protein